MDVIELSGNHLRDYDWAPLLEMLDRFDEKGYAYYAAGRDPEAAARPLIIEHNGNNFAFVGCNIAGPDHVYVDERHPGVNPCDLDAFEQQIRDLTDEGYLAVVLGLVEGSGRPLALLQSVHALEVHHVWPGALESRGLESSVEIDHQVIARGGFGCTAVEINHGLVVAVHKVDLEALDAHR